MKTGANRRIVSSGVFLIQEAHPLRLGKFPRVDFSQRLEAERDILDVYNRYQSSLQSEGWAPEHAMIEKKVGDLLSALDALQAASRAFLCVDEDDRKRLEYNAAIGDLLGDKGLSRSDILKAIEDARFPLDMLGTYLRLIRSELSDRLRSDALPVASSKAIRADYYRELHRMLVHHGLSDGVGESSFIVKLIMRLDGTETEENKLDHARRRQVARNVKLAVNPQKSG